MTISDQQHPSEAVLVALLERPIHTAVLFQFIPELEALKGCMQPPYHTLDVWGHTQRVVENIAPMPLLRVAALLHDIAKPLVKTEDEKGAHFYGHELVGAELAKTIVQRLGFGENFQANVVRMIQLHMRFNKYDKTWGQRAVNKLKRDAGLALFQPCILLAIADCSSDKAETQEAAQARLMHLYDRAYSIPAGNTKDRRGKSTHYALSPLNGVELQKLTQGQGPGQWINQVKKHLHEAVLAGRLESTDKARARELAKEYIRTHFSWG